MSDHITTRQSTVIPATVTSAAEVRGARRRRKAVTVACSALGALALAGGGFLAGAAVGQGAGDAGPEDVAVEQVFFGSSSLGSSGSLGSSSGRGGAESEADADGVPVDREEGETVADRSADAEPDPDAGKGSSGRTDVAVRGDVVEIEGEDVLVCFTGNGFGLSHIGVTLSEGAEGDATKAESERLCGDALVLAGSLVFDGSGDDLLATSRDVEAAGHTYECRPAAEKVLRCTAEDGTIVTLWSAEP